MCNFCVCFFAEKCSILGFSPIEFCCDECKYYSQEIKDGKLSQECLCQEKLNLMGDNAHF